MKRSGYDRTVTLVRRPGAKGENMSLAQAVHTVVRSPVNNRLDDAKIRCGDFTVAGLNRIAAIYKLPDFPR